MNTKDYYRKITNNFTDLTTIDIDGDEYINDMFETAISTYKNMYLDGLSYEEHDIRKWEKVFLIEDSLVVFFYVSKKKVFSSIVNKDVIVKSVVAQELTFNNIYKYSKEKFWHENAHPMTDIRFNINYINFTGNLDDDEYVPYSLYDLQDTFNPYNYISECYPELSINQRIENWDGWTIHFIIYELLYNDKKAYAIENTMVDNPLTYARKREKVLEKQAFVFLEMDEMLFTESAKKQEDRIRKIYTDCTGLGSMLIHRNFCNLAREIEKNSIVNNENVDETVNGRKVLFSGKMNYWVETKTIRDISNIMVDERKLLDEVMIRDNNDIEKMKFKLSEYKWKSEDLMVECIKKVFHENKVIRQHKPFFLQSKGQMSYDAFVSGLNIAFEYQGKQHFEPIDFFGGEESYKRQHERDLLKMELSKKNKVKLIYVNYDEDISINLIKEKLMEQGVNI